MTINNGRMHEGRLKHIIALGNDIVRVITMRNEKGGRLSNRKRPLSDQGLPPGLYLTGIHVSVTATKSSSSLSAKKDLRFRFQITKRNDPLHLKPSGTLLQHWSY
ncbi:hypothetical protein NE237_008163 [Protea cynaroides]|uniref:Uncharacterized protein n=1 Tax=Protea cynaroides TaxID=273540 RepID=A0A9Q0KQV8_9MAGN|nr:hypothetical protein NE237_008163 [Protea cynaroides]